MITRLTQHFEDFARGEDDPDVPAEAGDLETAVRELVVRRPDLLVLDFRMPNGSIAVRIGRLHEQSPRTAIVVKTMHAKPMVAGRALKPGAIAIVLKDAADLELPDAVRCAARGLEYRSPRLTRA